MASNRSFLGIFSFSFITLDKYSRVRSNCKFCRTSFLSNKNFFLPKFYYGNSNSGSKYLFKNEIFCSMAETSKIQLTVLRYDSDIVKMFNFHLQLLIFDIQVQIKVDYTFVSLLFKLIHCMLHIVN